MHHRVGESPSPWPYPAGDWAQYWRACRAVIFRLHRPASRRHGCLTRRRDKHYQPNEGKAASMVFTARFGAGTLPLFGYMPARRLGLGEDLPAPAMLQWGRWSAMPEYFYDDPEWDARQRAGKITLPILVLGFDDDPWANTEAISRLLAPAQNAKIERREIRRADYGLSSIGHMGFFRTRNAEKLWPLVAQWLERHCPDKRRTT